MECGRAEPVPYPFNERHLRSKGSSVETRLVPALIDDSYSRRR